MPMPLIEEELGTGYVSGDDMPWMPFIPLSEEVEIKYYAIDPVRGEMVVSMKFPKGIQLAPHYHTGTVIIHTVKGAWRYLEHDWVSKAGDTVYETAGSSHTPESCGDEDAEVFAILVGELLFLDENHNLLYSENWKTALARYKTFCEENGIEPRDLTDVAG